MLIFHRNRRDLIAKGLFDIFKLTLIAACVSGFFPNFSLSVRLGIYAMIGVTGITSILICPPPKKEE